MRWSFMGIVGSLSLSLVGCAGQADISLALGSTEELALSVEEAADAEAGAEGSEAALLLHVIRTEVHVAAAGGGDAEGEPADDAADDEGGEGGGFVVLSEEARDVDLYALSGTAEELASGPVPAGRLTQIRLILDADSPATLVAGGEETAVSVPSGAQTGLKLYAAPPVVLEDGSAVELGVEFGGLVGSDESGLVLTPALALTGGSAPIPEGAGSRAP